MLKTLREELDMLSDARKRKGFDRYTLSIASSGGTYFVHTEMNKLHVYLDWINVMTYDFSGEWSTTTAHHTALYRSSSAPISEPSTESFVKEHLSAGIPATKIVVGAAFYGRGWVRANRNNAGLYQSFDRYDDEYPYSKIGREYVPLLDFVRKWDNAAKAPYLWSAESGRFISYDDPQSLAEKANFVRRHRLGGVMYWEHSHDPAEVLLTALYLALR
jgi:chitinase